MNWRSLVRELVMVAVTGAFQAVFDHLTSDRAVVAAPEPDPEPAAEPETPITEGENP